MTVHGYPDTLWGGAKEEAKADLVPQIKAISFLATDQQFFFLLREISADEYRADRGMLTAVVVHKAGDYKPGPGFFDLARGLGLTVADTDRIWIEQINKVHDYWNAQQLS